MKGKKLNNSTTELGNHKLAVMLKGQGWTMVALEYNTGMSRQTIRKHLKNPRELMSLKMMQTISYMLKIRLVDVINAITEAPLCVDDFVQKEEFNDFRVRQDRWYDEK